LKLGQHHVLIRSAPHFRDQQIAAPLKPPPRRAALGGLSNFRDQQIAAPLKQEGGRVFADSAADFRDQQIAAPLKRYASCCTGRSTCHFRDQQIAAPLKPAMPPSPCRSSHLFPRSADRGPIEAQKSWTGAAEG